MAVAKVVKYDGSPDIYAWKYRIRAGHMDSVDRK